MKAVKVVAVLSLLVIFPAISYLYLIKGYNFRLEALQQLEAKKTLEVFNYSPVVTLEDILGRATIVYNADKKQAYDMLSPIYEQFSHRPDFQMIGFTIDQNNIDSSAISFQWRMVNSAYPFEKDLALIDTSGTIRNYYMLDSVSFTALGQHIPIIIPRKKDPDIVLKRDDEK
jgi:hypothetical protein